MIDGRLLNFGIGGRYRDNDIGLSVIRYFFPRYRFIGIADTFGSKLAIIDNFSSVFGSSLAQGRAARALEAEICRSELWGGSSKPMRRWRRASPGKKLRNSIQIFLLLYYKITLYIVNNQYCIIILDLSIYRLSPYLAINLLPVIEIIGYHR